MAKMQNTTLRLWGIRGNNRKHMVARGENGLWFQRVLPNGLWLQCDPPDIEWVQEGQIGVPYIDGIAYSHYPVNKQLVPIGGINEQPDESDK